VEHQDKDRTVGLVVDAVSEVYNLASAELRPPPDFGGAISSDFVTGLAMVEDKMVIVLDIDRLISWGVLGQVEAQVEQGEEAAE
jgi:purine-binding chemotaxis protein CheW